MSREASYAAVLTGDIIKSTDMTFERLADVRKTLGDAFEQIAPSQGRIEFYRGDGWQLWLSDAKAAFRLALYLRARLRAAHDADTRISIGLGGVDRPVSANIALSAGEAFTLSGRGLDAMPSHLALTAHLPKSSGALARWVPVACHLTDEIVGGWTQRQAEICAKALELGEATHQDIADSLEPPVAKQTVTASLAGAGWRALQAPLVAFEETDWACIQMSKVE